MRTGAHRIEHGCCARALGCGIALAVTSCTGSGGEAESADAPRGEAPSALSDHWQSEPDLTPPYHIAAPGQSDMGARFADVDGDGHADLVYHYQVDADTHVSGAYMYRADGWAWSPRFAPPFPIAAAGRGDLGVRLVDLDGDGRTDILYRRAENNLSDHEGAYLSNRFGWKSAPAFVPPYPITNSAGDDLGVRFVDLDGDGRTDMVYHRRIDARRSDKGAYLSTPAGWESAPQFVPSYPIVADAYGDMGVRFFDLNGDGRTDMVYHRYLDPNTSEKGAFLSRPAGWVSIAEMAPPFPISADDHADMGVRFIDLDGDGRTDMVFHLRASADTVQRGAYINRGSAWVWAADFIPPVPVAMDGVEDMGVRFVDLNGDGRIDMVYHRRIDARSSEQGAYLSTSFGWLPAPGLTPPVPIWADDRGDMGVRFVDLNGDGRTDMVYHRWLNGVVQQKGGLLNLP
ncbi:MAG: VCBS repeat-containing protein [Polyangiaceae bacterium]